MTFARPTYWLSMHVPYACRHAGACCTSGWPIPLERDRVNAVRQLRPDTGWLRVVAQAPADAAGLIAMSNAGHCVFHNDGCEIHRVLGHQALPAACQHFPRRVLLDARGVFVTLSHYCPTAAELLFTHVGPVEIVEGPAAVPEGEPEGLDARGVLPPLLWVGSGLVSRGQVLRAGPRPSGVLMDLDGYSAWEAHMVRVLTADDSATADHAIAALQRNLATLRSWRPGAGSLRAQIATLPPGLVRLGPGHATEPGETSQSAHDEVVIRRYLAARAFASWAAYDAGGVAAVVQSLRDALWLVRNLRRRWPLKEAIRRADLQMLHVAPASARRAPTSDRRGT